MKNVGVYIIISKHAPNKFYIGSSLRIKERWYQHRRYLGLGRHHSRKLQDHVNLYGIEDLEFYIITKCSEQDKVELEQYYIDILKPFFNTQRKVTDCIIAQTKADYWGTILVPTTEKRWKQGVSFYYSLYN
jgi:group I intron endonuclease